MREASVGERLDQYQLTDVLARSGMASIFKAIDSATGATVVLKIPHPQFESDVVFYERFRREEELGLRLEHPNIVRVLRPKQKSRMYMVMEYVEGKSLRALMQGSKPMASETALGLAIPVCEALAYMHERKVVHRDMKPENILVTAAGCPKILDFGIAFDASARRLTWAGLSNTIGTPDYMAPEQIGGRRGDARTDVYALGTILYEMLTGELPYSAANPHALLRAKANEDPTLPSYYVPGLDRRLEAILLKALERSPRDRYAGAAELLADLRNPAAVPPYDPEKGRVRRRFSVPRRLLMPLVVVFVLAGLTTLIWCSHPHRSGPGRATQGRVQRSP
jgi:serine/threonine-protein kinase